RAWQRDCDLLLSSLVSGDWRQCRGRFLYAKGRTARDPSDGCHRFAALSADRGFAAVAADPWRAGNAAIWRTDHGAGGAGLVELHHHPSGDGAVDRDLRRQLPCPSERGAAMSGLAAGLTGFAALLALMAIRVPIGVAMLSVGIGGYGLYSGVTPLL